jgi:hypothetical protein
VNVRSVLAVMAGIFTVVALSVGTDQVMHDLGVFPPKEEPMRDVSDNLLALGYRSVYAVLGAYVAARMAPEAPMRHALILGGIGMVPGVLGVVASTQMDLGPIWYPVALVVTTLPCAWLGGTIYRLTAPQK